MGLVHIWICKPFASPFALSLVLSMIRLCLWIVLCGSTNSPPSPILLFTLNMGFYLLCYGYESLLRASFLLGLSIALEECGRNISHHFLLMHINLLYSFFLNKWPAIFLGVRELHAIYLGIWITICSFLMINVLIQNMYMSLLQLVSIILLLFFFWIVFIFWAYSLRLFSCHIFSC